MIRVLAALARVSDKACASAEDLRKQLEEALSWGLRNGTVTLNVVGATESALRSSFSEERWDVMHLVAPVRNSAASRSTVDLESANGGMRSVTAQYLADMLAQSNVDVLVLHSCDAQSSFETVAPAIAARCPAAVVTAHDLPPNSMKIFLAKLHSAIAGGEMPDRIPLPSGGVRFWSKPKRSLQTAEAAPEPVAKPTPVKVDVDPSVKAVLDRKRELAQFDVFLCHNSLDKPSVRKVAAQLKQAGLLPWLDESELPPGMPWLPILEGQIQNIGSAAVFFGAAGMGPWQEEEVNGFLREFMKRHLPVIPVLLPDAPLKPELPVFLGARGWVDFRGEDGQPLERLIWAITGVRPANF